MTSVIGDKDIPEFDFKIHPLKNLDHLIIVFSDGKQTFSLYKSLYQVEMIAKSNTSFLAKLQMDKSKLEVFNEPIMRISNSFQMIQVNGTVIILYNDFAEKSLKIHEILKNQSKKGIKILKERGLIKGISDFDEHNKDLSFSRRLVKVLADSKIISDGIDKEALFSFIESDTKLKKMLPIHGEGDRRHFDVSKRSSAETFLELIDDEFVSSELTHTNYIALEKRDRDKRKKS